jgi:hypothetical protein
MKYNITPEMILAAEAMIADDMDYWPYGLIDYPVSENADYCLYSYEDGVWLVDTNNTCSMKEAIKLALVLSV